MEMIIILLTDKLIQFKQSYPIVRYTKCSLSKSSWIGSDKCPLDYVKASWKFQKHMACT